jgi:hypothetical protein
MIMLRKVGRFLQLLGLFIAPVGIAGNLARPDEVNVKTSLGIGAVGMLLFTIGWLIQQMARP